MLFSLRNKFVKTLEHVESNLNDYNSKEVYPKVTRILYHLVNDVYIFFQTPQGIQLLSDLEQKKVNKIIFVPFEPYKISTYERFIFSKIKHIFDNKKVFIECNDILSEGSNNLTFSIVVLEVMMRFLKTRINNNPQKHFLSLNKRKKLERIILFDFLKQNNLLKKGITSFHWLNQSPDIKNPLNHDDDIIQPQLYEQNNLIPLYENTLFEILCPSNQELICEKTLKPLLMGKPFLIWNYEFLNYEDFENYKISGFSKEINVFNKTLYYFNWYKKIGIDINYFDLDLENPRCIKNKIKELCNMSIEDIQIKYSKTFEKSKLNQKLINKFINKKGKEWNLSNEYNHQNYLY